MHINLRLINFPVSAYTYIRHFKNAWIIQKYNYYVYVKAL